MNRRKLLKRTGAAIVTGSTVATAGCLGSGPDSVSLEISTFGSWSGSIGDENGQQTIGGRGNDRWTWQNVPTIVSATVQKDNQDNDELTVSILTDGNTVQQRSTREPFGVVSVSHNI